MAAINDSKKYKIKNPQTGDTESWLGERIRIYQQTYGVEVVLVKNNVKAVKSETNE